MIDFSCNGGVIGKLVVSGGMSDIFADTCALLSLMYGSLLNESEDAANEYRSNLLNIFVDKELHDKVFSDGYYKTIVDSKLYTHSQVSQKVDMKELKKQLKELEDELSKQIKDILEDKEEDESE